MATPFDRLMDTLRPYLPGAIDEAIKQELFMVCHEFFDRSDVWREELDFTTIVGKQEADIMPYAGRILRLIDVTRDGLGVRGAFMLDVMQGILQMPYEATEPVEYKANVSLTVTDPISRDAFPIIPYDIAKKYMDVFFSGVLSRMLSQPVKPYTNLTLAQYHLLKFNGKCARAKNETKSGSTQGSQVWKFPQTFNRRK